MNIWRIVTESLPAGAPDVLVYVDGRITVGYYDDTLRRWAAEGDWVQVTHWMPLPEKPPVA